MKSTHERRTDVLEYDRRRDRAELDALKAMVRKLQEDLNRQRQPFSGDGMGSDSLGITTTAFAARNGNVLPGGTVKLTMPVPTTDLATCTNTDAGRTVRAYNWTGGTVESGKLVILVRMYGVWLLLSQDCSNVAVPNPASNGVLVTQNGNAVVTQSGQQMTSQ